MEKRISSSLRTTFLVHAILGTIFGLIYLIAPGRWSVLIGWPATGETRVLGRIIGAALLGFASSSWLALLETSWEKVIIVVRMEIVWAGLAALVTLWALLSGLVPTIGWAYFVIFAGFAVAFSLFYSREPAK